MSKPRISLLNFLLITALISMGFALFVAMKNGQSVAKENEHLKYQLGHIEVKDPTKVYVRQLNYHGLNSLNFRLQWPENYRGNYLVGKTTLRANGKPDLENVGLQDGTFASHPVGGDIGQHEVVFSWAKKGQHWLFAETTIVLPPKPVLLPGNLPNENHAFGTYFAESVADQFFLTWPANQAVDFPRLPDYFGFRHGMSLSLMPKKQSSFSNRKVK